MSESESSKLRPLGLRMHAGSPFITYIHIKEHRGITSGGPALFVAGLPMGTDEGLLAQALGCFGDISQVVLHTNKRSGMALFVDERARAAAIKAAAQAQIIELDTSQQGSGEQASAAQQEPTGLRAWVLQHKAQRPGNQELQRQLDEWTAAHEEEEARLAAERQAAMAEDGWTVVVRSKGRKKTTDAGGVAVQSGGVALAAAQATAAKDKSKPLEDFYKFQQREKRRNDLLDLRKKFQEDRQRISELRASRKFKPFAA